MVILEENMVIIATIRTILGTNTITLLTILREKCIPTKDIISCIKVKLGTNTFILGTKTFMLNSNMSILGEIVKSIRLHLFSL